MFKPLETPPWVPHVSYPPSTDKARCRCLGHAEQTQACPLPSEGPWA